MTSNLNNSSRELPQVGSYDSVTSQSWLEKWKELLNYRFLLKNSVMRDVKVRYKNSAFGVLWSLLNPLFMMVVYTILFTKLMPNNNIRMYPIFILVALIPWQFFAGSLMGGTACITGNSSLLRKVYFPRTILPISILLSNLVNFLLAFIVLIVLLYAFGIGLTIHALWVPAILFTQFVFMLGMVLMLGTFNVFYRDVAMILDVVMLAWFFMTPVFYPLERLTTVTIMGVSFDSAILMRWLNPMASIVDGYRTVLWGTLYSDGPVSMDPLYLLRTFITSVIICIIGYYVFHRYENNFAEKL